MRLYSLSGRYKDFLDNNRRIHAILHCWTEVHIHHGHVDDVHHVHVDDVHHGHVDDVHHGHIDDVHHGHVDDVHPG